MRTPPPDLTETEVGASIGAQWSITAASLEYAAVGFGSHHWVLTEPNLRRWFVTADAVADSAHRLAELTAALTTAHALHHHCGLEFVVAPRPGLDHGLLSIAGRYAVALYPYLERTTEAPADPQQMLSMITALHATTPDVDDLATVDDLTIPDRSTLEAVFANAGTLSRSGPFTADFATLVREHEQPIRAALHRHDAMASTLGAERATWVITHGEPKANNTMITAAGPVLVDWDTVQLAPPARDLWMSGSVDSYASITGRDVPTDQLDFYRLRWDLKDLCGSASWFTRPHQRTTDTELAWQGSIKICRRLAVNGR
jgi:spectinomycin phosphotransferase/16S rRNA (guanine(1405)-N(7))-methyltransferase